MRIESDLEFLQLVKLSDEEIELGPQMKIAEREFPAHLKKEQACYWEFDKDEKYVVNSYCYMYVTDDAIYYEKKPICEDMLLTSYILGWGMGAFFYRRKEYSIHCSCLAYNNEAVLISGDSGAGKSTVTAALLERGYGFMADDVAVIKPVENGIVATSAFPFQKLCRDVVDAKYDSYDNMIYIDEDKDKYLVPFMGEFIDKPIPVKALFVIKLVQEGEVDVVELRGAQKLIICMEALFMRPLLGEILNRPDSVAWILKIADKMPVYEVNRPVGKDTKQEIIDSIVGIIEEN